MTRGEIPHEENRVSEGIPNKYSVTDQQSEELMLGDVNLLKCDPVEDGDVIINM